MFSSLLPSLTQLSRKMGVWRWLPFVSVAATIFFASSQSSDDLPSFGVVDHLVKKGGHFLGYMLLALAYQFANSNSRSFWQVVLVCLVYAVTDEAHQIFSEGRYPSWVDVLIFDHAGIWTGVYLWNKVVTQTQGQILHR